MSKKNGKLLGRFAPILAVALALLGAGVAEVAVAATEMAPDPMPPHPDLRDLANRGLIALPDAVTNPELRRLLGINEADVPLPVQPSGSWRALALLVQFTDNPASVGATSFDNLLFSSGTGTLRDYYDEVSYGTLDIVTVNLPSSIGWMTMPQTYAYYVNGANGFGAYPQNAQRLAEDAVWAANPVVDYSQYDNDSDGWVDSLFIIHAGPGAEFTGNPNHIWSHKWSMVNDPFVDGVTLNAYTMEPEYWASPGDMTVGVYAHELAHAFGLPDLYDIDGSARGIGKWGLMGGGSWNGSLGDSPAWLSAWSRAFLGWVTPTSVVADTPGVSIPAAETSQTVYRLWTEGSIGNEYFLVENRQPIGYDAQLPGFGLLIWHIDENKAGNESECDQLDNWNCGSAHLLVALEQSDGLWDLEHDTDGGDPGDPFPGTTNSLHFDFGTVPNSSSYYSSLATCVAVSNIGPSSSTMVADLGVSCTPPSVGPVVYDSYLVDDDNSGNSSGNADGYADCGETVELFVDLQNLGTDPATQVNATISTTDPYVTFLFNTSSSYGDIGGGASSTNVDDFDFSIDPATPHGHSVTFDLAISATNGGPWNDSFSLPVFCLSPDAFEPDNEAASATPITSGISQTHNLYPVGDEDWVSFTVGEESEIVLETSGPSGDSVMWLYDASLTQLEYNDDGGTGLWSRIDRVCGVDALPAGTYYARVEEYGDNHPIAEYDIAYTRVRPCTAGTVALISDQGELAALTPILDEMGLTYDVLNNNWNGSEGIYTSNSSLLSAYSVVVWYASGTGFGRLTTQQEHDTLESYLQSGGRLLVTGYDTIGSPPDALLADLIRSNGSGDGPFTTDFVVTDGNHPITNGPFGSFPANTNLVAAHSDHDQAEADTTRGAVTIAELVDGHDKILATELPGDGIVVYWNGNRDASDWIGLAASLPEPVSPPEPDPRADWTVTSAELESSNLPIGWTEGDGISMKTDRRGADPLRNLTAGTSPPLDEEKPNPASESVTFPATGDVVSVASDPFWWHAGDFAEGVRTLTLSNVTGVDYGLVISDNRLTGTGYVDFDLSINATVVGSFTVLPGETSKQVSFSFAPISGPNYTIRLEETNTVDVGGGSIVIPLDNSSMTFSNSSIAENVAMLKNTLYWLSLPPADGPLVYESHLVDDDNSGNSDGNGDGVVDCGETIELFVHLHNNGSEAAVAVNATIATTDPWVVFLFNTTSGYGDILGGTSATNTNDFDFSVDPATPHGHLISFDLDITATNGDPWADSFTVPVQCGGNDPPVSDPNGPYAGTVGQPVQFDGSSSFDLDGTIVAFDWDFGDSTTGSGATPSHTYAAAGLYTVSLTVTDDGGATDTGTTTADIVELLPDIEVAPSSFNVTLNVSEIYTQTLSIGNVGTGNLEVILYEEETGHPAPPFIPRPARPEGDLPARSDNASAHSPYPSATIVAGNPVLILQDTLPWGFDSIQQILSALGVPFDQVDSSQIPTVDLTPYEMVIVPSVQGDSFYTTWNANIAKFETYVGAGGKLWQSTTNFPGSMEPLTVGGVVSATDLDNFNDVVAAGHPWVLGVPTPIEGTAASHDSFTNLFPGSQVVVQTQTTARPTLVEYGYGSGRVLITGMTLEFAGSWGWDAAPILENSLIDMLIGADAPWLSLTPTSATIPQSAEQPVTVTFDATGLVPGNYEAAIIIASNDPDENPTIVPVGMSVLATGADLEVIVSDDLDPAFVGSEVTYDLTVTNAGPEVATSVYLTDTLPAPVTLVSVQPGEPTCTEAGRTLTCALGTLSPTESSSVTIVVRAPDSAASLLNVATVTSDIADPYPEDNSAGEQTLVITEFLPHDCDVPGNPIGNCSFELGFTGWITQDMSTPFFPLQVAGAGMSPGFGLFSSEPTDGNSAVLHGFDGDGPGWIRIAQDIDLPTSAASLVFDYRAAWDLVNYSFPGAGDRLFEVNIEPPGGGAPLQTTSVLTATVSTVITDTANLTGIVDLSSFAGSPVRVAFDWYIPDDFTGPGFFQLDNVLVATEPAKLRVEPGLSEVPLGGAATVDLVIDDVADLFGASLEITFDPSIVQVVDDDPGTPGVQITPGSCPSPDFIVQNSADNALGTVNYDVTSLSPTPPCDGTGLLASISFTGAITGTSPVHFNEWLLSDTNGQSIQTVAQDGTLEVVATLGTLDGHVLLQGRGDHTGAQVCVWDGGNPAGCTTTDSAGYYDLSLPQGTYDVIVEMDRYLDSEKVGVATAVNNTTTLPDLHLKGGDTNDDDIVNILDLAFMGSRYSLACGEPGFDERADINDDCTVNILDIVLGGSNYLMTSPVPWP
jgi:M6 family metalloprotease-like protein/uncharacterized repeat protein (TIGR01451 family)